MNNSIVDNLGESASGNSYSYGKRKPKISYALQSVRIKARSGQGVQATIHFINSPTRFVSSTFCIALLNYLVQTETDDLDRNYTKFRMVSRVFVWISEKFAAAQELPKDIVEQYHGYFKQQDLVESSICQYIAQLRAAIDWALTKMYLEQKYEQRRNELQEIFSYIPSVPNNRVRPRLCLSEVTTGVVDDERVLVRSAMRFCCAFLQEMNKYRNELRNNPRVESKLQELLRSCGGDFTALKWTCSGGHYKRDYRDMAVAIMTSENCTLKELLLCNRLDFVQAQHDSGQELSSEIANGYIKAGLTEKGGLNFSTAAWPAPLNFENLDYLFLIKHLPAEEICFAWLLATDRIQQAGISNLKLSDVKFTPSSVSVEYIKNRSCQPLKESPNHPKGSLRYSVYDEYVSLRSKFLNRFPRLGQAKLFDVHEPGSLQVFESSFFRPLILASLPHTRLYCEMQKINKEIPPFAKILENVSRHNQELRTKRVATKKGELISCEKKRQSITVNVIAQSRAILDEDTFGYSNGAVEDISTETFNRYSQDVVGAAATAHTSSVKERFYIHASTSKYRLEKRAAFASAVGELMVADALKINELCSKNSYLTVEQIKIFLGWQMEISSVNDIEEFDKILSELRNKGWSITPFGQLESDVSTIIIVNRVEAAMLLSYQDECQRQLEALSINEELRASALIMQIAYAEAVLERFDRKTISEGRALVGKFPAPIIR